MKVGLIPIGDMGTGMTHTFANRNMVEDVGDVKGLVSDTRKKYYQAYKVLSKHGLLDKYYPEKKAHPKKEKIWTIEKSLTIVNQCTSRFDLSRKFPGAYVTLRNAGLLDKYFPTKWVKPFTEEEKAEIIAACKTRSELHHKHKSIYDYLRRAGLMDEYFPK